MKVIIFGGYYKKELDANAIIASKIATEFCINNDCHLVFLDETANDIKIINKSKLSLAIIPIDEKYRCISNHYNKNNKKGKIAYVFNYPIKALKYLLYKNGRFLKYKDLISYIHNLLSNEEFDYFLSFSLPFFPTLLLYKQNFKNIKMVYCQLDPWGLHELLPKCTKIIRIIEELYVINKSYRIFTTNILYKQYKSNILYNRYNWKIVPLNLPNLELSKKKESFKSMKKNDNSIYYFGTIDDKYRNPKKIIDFIVSSNLNTSIHFFGINKSKQLSKAVKKYPGKIFVHNTITHDKVLSIMEDNVFLLNINNSISNQEPSKLIEYISSGKPIINCIKINNDSSIKILEKYPLVYNFYENKNNNLSKFVDFITINSNKCIDKSIIFKLYNEYSSPYIVNKILENL